MCGLEVVARRRRRRRSACASPSGSGVPSASVSGVAVLVDRRAGGVDVAPEVVDRPPVLGLEREALARRSAAARSGAGTSRSCRCGRRSGTPRPHRARRASRPSSRPRRPSRPRRRAPGTRAASSTRRRRPRSARRRSRAHRPAPTLRRGEHDSSCAPVLNVPLASTVPSASSATANGLPGTSAAAHASACSTSSNVRSTTLGCAPKAATAGASTRHRPQPSDVNTASPIRPRLELARTRRRARCSAPTSGPSWATSSAPARRDRQPQHPDLAREREHDDRQRDEPDQREAEPDREPLFGARLARAAAAARARARPPAPPPGRPRPCPSRPARAEARARRARRGRRAIAATCTAHAAAMKQRAGPRRPVRARRRRRRRAPTSTAISAAHTPVRRRAATGSRTSPARPAPRRHRPPSTPRQRPARAPGRGRPQPRPLTAAKVTAFRARPTPIRRRRRPQETLRCRSSAASSGPARTQNGCVVGILPFFSTSRATFVLKFGALTHTSTVCPARNLRCFLRQRRDARSKRRFFDLARLQRLGLERALLARAEDLDLPALRELLRDLQRLQREARAA